MCNMWRCLVIVTLTLLVAVRSNVPQSPARNTNEQQCSVDNDCESGFICSSRRKCVCGNAQVLSSDGLTCLDAVLYGDPCNHTEQCLAHLQYATCKTTCQCEQGFEYVEANGDHSCVAVTVTVPVPVTPGLKKYKENCTSSDECEEPFTNCMSHMCECPVNHTVTKDKMLCVTGSGPPTAHVSVGLLTLACLLSFLLIGRC